MKANITTERNITKETLIGLMGHIMRVNSTTTILKEWVLTPGLMVVNTPDNGKIIKCMVKVSLLGQMEGNILGNIKMIKSMGSVPLCGLMEENMKEIG